jgi:hypothetical protein
MIFLVFSVAIDLFEVRTQYRNDSAYIIGRKRFMRGSNCQLVFFFERI